MFQQRIMVNSYWIYISRRFNVSIIFLMCKVQFLTAMQVDAVIARSFRGFLRLPRDFLCSNFDSNRLRSEENFGDCFTFLNFLLVF